VQLHLTIDLRAVILGVVLLLVAAGIATPFAISLADDEPAGETSSAQPITLGTAFTYQGQLNDASGPANGTYDLRFTLFDADTAGTVVAGPISVNDIIVADGLFTATIDFGAGALAGSERWLLVEAKATASQTFDALTPRQPLSAVPYALFALSGGTQYSAQSPIALNGTTFGFSTQGCIAGAAWKYNGATWSCDPVPVPYTAGSGLTLTGNQFAVNFAGSGSLATVSRSNHDHFGQSWSGNSPNSGVGLNVYNGATSGVGIVGQASSSIGYIGYRGKIGVLGSSGSGICGAVALDTINAGVHGANCGSGEGVSAYSFQGAGVYGASSSSDGVHGYSPTAAGVYGQSTSGYGVYGAGGTGWAGYFNGDVGIPANRDCYCSILPPSDLRLKRDVGSARYGLAATLALAARSYRWNEETDDEDVHLGFIAQEVQMIMPELVKESRDGMLALDYIGIIPVLTRAIQEQQAQIETLRTSPEPSPSGALDTAPKAGAPVALQVTAVRQSAGPSNAAIYTGAGAVVLFALGLFAVAGVLVRRPVL
jgi:hypothetical protein